MTEISPEQKARDMLERIGVPNAQSYSSGELVELANIICDMTSLREQVKELRDQLSKKIIYQASLE